ncbi:MAG: ATP-dependent zinc metalloprotease FtsH [Bradymonadales bacterium]|nr:ATP-dependent zinc metalloprotease FtsH [Bradymonadales bacterium]
MSDPQRRVDRRTGRPGPSSPDPAVRRRNWALIILFALAFALLFTTFSDRGVQIVAYSELKEYIRIGHVEEVVITANRIEAIPSEIARQENEELSDSVRRWRAVRVPEDEDLVGLIESRGIKLSGREDHSCQGGLFWFWVLPLLLLLVFWGAMFRRIGGGAGAQALTFGKAKFKLFLEEGTGVGFKDVAGIDEVKEELQEVVEFLKEPERFIRLGGRIPKGVLLVGPPGTGKTLLARAVAGEASVPFFNISGSDFVEMFVGVGAARVRDLFEQATRMAPCIIFIDELDAVGRARGAAGQMGGNEEREQTLNALLVEMDGFSPKQSVIILAATNRPEILDPALLRPGRFDRQILVDRPDIKGREEILKVHTKKLLLGDDINLERIAAQTPGFVGADLANVVNEAALLAARRRRKLITQADFQDAIERVIAGLEKKNRRMNEREKWIVAFHEAGHAISSTALPFADPVHKVSIIPRGIGALGYTLQLPLEDRYLMTREELLDKIGSLLGGRAAEIVTFGDVSTGAQNDLLKATDLVKRMITEYGMSQQLGPVYLGETNQLPGFLGALRSNREYSDQTAQRIDQEVQALIEAVLDKVVQILQQNQQILENLAQCLLSTEVVEGEALENLLSRVKQLPEDLDRLQSSRIGKTVRCDRNPSPTVSSANGTLDSPGNK